MIHAADRKEPLRLRPLASYLSRFWSLSSETKAILSRALMSLLRRPPPPPHNQHVWGSMFKSACLPEAERSERNTFAERLSAVEAIANAISVVSSNSSGNRTGSSSSRG